MHERRGLLASLDATSLFANVPIDATIDVILQYVYESPTVPPLRLSKDILREMLYLCTKEAPFRCPEGNLYQQANGVAMGSPLGVLFAECYISSVEDQVLQSLATQPYIYCRYVDDICVDITTQT